MPAGEIMQALSDAENAAGRLAARQDTLEWLSEMYAAVDDRDAQAFADYFAADGTLRFGNEPPVEGPEAVRQVIAAFFEDLAGLEHDPRNVIERSGAVVFEASVTYDLPDGGDVTVPATTVIERTGWTVDAMRIYVDLAPLRG